MSLYDISVTNMQDETYPLKQFKGKVLLIVNTASQCGYTKQFASLQTLYERYKDEGLEILGFPSNQFKNQDPLSNKEILEFCTLHFGVSFKMYKKTHVKDKNIHPLFDYLVHNNLDSNEPVAWNFEKFLINKEGHVLKRYPSKTDPLTFENEIKEALKL